MRYTGPPALLDLKEFAHHLADTAGTLIRRHFRGPLKVEAQTDGSVVSDVDRAVELELRALIQRCWPDHGIVGEEFDEHNSEAALQWMIDPIDGSGMFISGMPVFGTLISCVYLGHPLIGVIDQPILQERWLGCAGAQTRLNGAPVVTKSLRQLSQAIVFATHPDMFANDHRQTWNRVKAACQRVMYGADCYAYAMLASGYVDAIVETGIRNHDIAALYPVVTGAGGHLSDWQGRAPQLHGSSNIVAASNRSLHRELLSILSASEPLGAGKSETDL